MSHYSSVSRHQPQPRSALATPMAPTFAPSRNDFPSAGPAAKSRKIMSKSQAFTGGGTIVLFLACCVPVWNAVSLLNNENYAFWVDRTVPSMMIILCGGTMLLFIITVNLFFSHTSRTTQQNEQTIMSISNSFLTLLGVILMLVSMPLSRQSQETYNNLMHRCDYSEQTHRLYEYSQVLHNIRATPECAKEITVENCNGYDEAPPYTSFLKRLETTSFCSGFCYRSPQSWMSLLEPANVTIANHSPQQGPAGVVSTADADADAADAVLIEGVPVRPLRHQDHVTPLGLLQVGAVVGASAGAGGVVARGANSGPLAFSTSSLTSAARGNPGERPLAGLSSVFAKPDDSMFPPTLFSDANHQASCEGMAARDMKNFVGDAAAQTFSQGIYLVLVVIFSTFLRMIGLCNPLRYNSKYVDEGSYGAA